MNAATFEAQLPYRYPKLDDISATRPRVCKMIASLEVYLIADQKEWRCPTIALLRNLRRKKANRAAFTG